MGHNECCYSRGLVRGDVKIPTYKPHTNHKKPSVRSHTLAPTTICDLSHSLCGSPLTDLGHISSVTYVCHPLWFVCGHRKGIFTSPLSMSVSVTSRVGGRRLVTHLQTAGLPAGRQALQGQDRPRPRPRRLKATVGWNIKRKGEKLSRQKVFCNQVIVNLYCERKVKNIKPNNIESDYDLVPNIAQYKNKIVSDIKRKFLSDFWIKR